MKDTLKGTLTKSTALAMLLGASMSVSACVSGGALGDGVVLEAHAEETAIEETPANSEVIEIAAQDGYALQGKLTLPSGEESISKLVIYVNGSGPHTYDDHRNIGEDEFNYFDFFADSFSSQGAAFFSYSTRGVSNGTEPPMFINIDEEAYKTYLPTTSVDDVYAMIQDLKAREPRLKDSRVILLGWSEGTLVAPLFAEKYPGVADSLFLGGYMSDNLKDVLIWQNDGSSRMVLFNYFLDTDGDGIVSEAEFLADPSALISGTFGNVPFSEVDMDKDGFIQENDWAVMTSDYVNEMFAAIENGDDQWLKDNYPVQLTSAWFKDHFNLRTNKEILPGLDLPIHIYHGTLDLNVDVEGVYAIRDKFAELGKDNLTVHVYDGYDHDMNFTYIPYGLGIPEGLQNLIDTILGF